MATNTDFIVKNGLVVTDSASFGNTITGTDAVFSGTVTASNILDSAQITNIAIATGVDSAYVISQVNALVDAAPGALDTLNELAAALGDDANFSTTITNLIAALPDSSQVASIITSYGYSTYDSANTLGLVDSAYVQLRQTPQDFAYASLTGAPTNVSQFTNDAGYLTDATTLDSAEVLSLIDSAYISNRFPTGGSSEVITPVAFAFVNTTANGSGTGISWSNWNAGTATLDFTFSTAQPDTNYAIITDCDVFDDYNVSISSKTTSGFSASFYDDTGGNRTPSSVAPFTFLIYGSNPKKRIAGLVGDYLDSAAAINLIDSAYIAARTSAGTDSAAIINLIDSSYIQLRQANEVAAPFSLLRYDFTATSGQSSFTGLNIEPNKFEVYLNGLLLSTADYTSTSTQVDLTVAADSGDILNVIKYTGNEVIGGAVPLSQTTYEFIADSAQTVFTGADANALTLSYVSGKIQVYINGILLRGSTDYTATNGNSVTLTLGADSGDVVQIETLTGNNVGIDSSQVQSLIDSAYIIARAGGGSIDSAKTQQIIDSNFLQVSSHLIPKFDSAYDLGSPTKQWKDLYLSGNSIYLGGHVIHTNSTGIRLVDSLGAEIAITASNILDSAQIHNIATAAGIDSAYVTSQINALIDTAPGTLDTLNELAAALGDDANFSTTVTNLIATKLDSAQTIALIDSAYVNARVSTGVDSAYVASQISASPGGVTVTEVFDSAGRVGIASPVEGDVAVQFGSGPGVPTGVTYSYNGAQILSWSPGTNSQTNAEFTLNNSTFAAAAQPGDVIVLNGSVQWYNSYSHHHIQPSWNNIQSGTLILGIKSVDANTGNMTVLIATTAYYSADGANRTLNSDLKDYFDNPSNPRGLIPSNAVTVYDNLGTNSNSNGRRLIAYDATLYKMFTSNIQSGLDTSAGSNTSSDDVSGNVTALTNQNPRIYLFNDSAWNPYFDQQITGTIDSSYLSGYIDSGWITDRYTPTITEIFDSDQRVAITSPLEGDVAVQFRSNPGIYTGISHDFTVNGARSTLWSYTVYARSSNSFIYDFGNGRFQWSNSTFDNEVQKGDVIVVESGYMSTNPGVISGGVNYTGYYGTFIFVCHTPKIGAEAPWYNIAAHAHVLSPSSIGAEINSSLRGYFGNPLNTRGSIPSNAEVPLSYININNSSATSTLQGTVAKLYRFFDPLTYADGYDNNGTADPYNGSNDATFDAIPNTKPLVYFYNDVPGQGSAFRPYVQDQILGTIDSAYVQARAGVTSLIDSAYIQARQVDIEEATFNIVNNGSSAYTFTGNGFSSSSDNPTLYLTRGHTYKFSVNATGHPFEIRTSNGGSAYSTGVTNNAAATGDIIFTPDMSAPKNLVYQCQVHSGMVGNIVILDGVIPNVFTKVHVSGQNNIVAESSSDVLVFEAGPGISITTDPNTDTVTIINDLNATVAAAIIDSAYVQQRQTHYLDSALVTQLIDSAYVTARAPAGGGGSVDSAAIIALIDSDYINVRAGGSRSEFTLDRWSYTATAAQTVFTGADNNAKTLAITDTDLIEVYLNGVLLVDSDDYSATTSSITLVSAATAGYSLQVIERRGRVITQRGFVETKYYYTTAVPTTIFSGADDNSAILDLSNGHVDVHLNGILLKDSNDYSTTSTTVTLVSATDSGDVVTVTNRKGTVVTPTLKSYNYTADSGQTLITGADDNGSILTYVNGQVQVFLNGILLRSDIDFTAANGSGITFINALDSADDVVVATYAAPGTILNQYRYLAESGQTVFNGPDVNSEFLSYEPSNTQVFLNGILLTDSDYNATNGSSVVLTNAANINDDVVISAYDQGVVQLRRNTWSAPSTTPYPAVAGDKLLIDTSSAKTITLPSSATLGDEIRIIDAIGNASTNNITVARNGHNIQGSATNLTINIDRAGIGLVYYNVTQGWILIEN